MKVLMIDNYDSFTFNLVQYLGELSVDVEVIRNDKCTFEALKETDASHIMVSPGPGTPQKSGISMQVIKEFTGIKPILGVCLGHQCIGQIFGGNIIHANQIVHGKTSQIYHDNRAIFTALEMPFTATRYHSLVIEKDTLPNDLEITAWTQLEDGKIDEIMGIRHKKYAIYGVQFHPESILTSHGHTLLKNFLNTS